MTRQTKYVILAVVIIAVLVLALDSIYVVSETNQVIITKFGQPIGEEITNPGLHFKTPFIQKANYFEKRWL